MHIKAKREALLAACQAAAAASGKRDVKPLLRCVHLVADKDGLAVSGTDLEVSLERRVGGVECSEADETSIQAEKLVQILREMPDEEVVVESSTPHEARIVGERAEFEVPANATEFPAMPAMGADAVEVPVRAEDLRRLFARTGYAAASAEHSRYGATTGILLEKKASESVLWAVGTDGRVLSVDAVPAEEAGQAEFAIVVPPRAIRLILANCDDGETVLITADRAKVRFKAERVTVTSLLTEGRFPRWRDVLPQAAPGDFAARFAVGTLLSAVRQAAIMSNEESKAVLFDFAKNKLTMTAKGADVGRAQVEIAAAAETAVSKMKTALDPKFVRNFLGSLGNALSVEMRVPAADRPVLFRVDDRHQVVIVPLVKSGGA